MADHIGIRDLTDKVASHALRSGWFEQVNTFEPDRAPTTEGLTAAVWIEDITPVPARSGLTSTSLNLTFNVRLIQNWQTEPKDALDATMIEATDALLSAYSADFTLDGSVAAVDLLGMHGPPLSADAGYIEEGERLFRVMTVVLPLLKDDVWPQEA